MDDNLVFGGDRIVEDKDSLSVEDKESHAITSNILKNKQKTFGEVNLTLFESCNLTCRFCNQDHASSEHLNTIRDKVAPAKEAILTLQKMGKKTFGIRIQGGELFQDSFNDTIFDDYIFLVNEIYSWSLTLEIEVSFSFITNLIHFNTNRVKNFLFSLMALGIDVDLITSYDPVMRFSKADLIVFRKNLEIYQDFIGTVNTIMSKPNIDKFLSGDIPHFDFIYDHFDVYFDYYTPESHFDQMSPSDMDMRDFYIFLLENYPNAGPTAEFLNTGQKQMVCQSTIFIMQDGSVGRCQVLLNKPDQLKVPKTPSNMELNFIKKMDCLKCEYFSKCGLSCFIHNHFNSMKTSMNYCWIKDVHAFVENKKNVK